MKSTYLVAGLVISLGLSSCDKKTNEKIEEIANKNTKILVDTLANKKNTVSKPKISYQNINLTPQQKTLIETTINEYSVFYGCGIKELIIVKNKKKLLAKKIKNKIITTEAYANKKTMHLNIDTKKIDDQTLKNIIIHMLFGVIKPDKMSVANVQFILEDGYAVQGYNGLSVVTKKGKDITTFTKIEEAAAEACAKKFFREYSVNSDSYGAVGSLMLKMIAKGWVTEYDLIAAQKNNSMIHIVAKIFNKAITPKDIEEFMQLFQDVYKTEADITNDVIDAIEKMRLKND